MKPLTPAEMRELHAKTTQGEWLAHSATADDAAEISVANLNGLHEPMVDLLSTEDAAFIVAAHNSMPALLDRIEELEAIRAAAQDVLDCDGGHRSKCYHAAKSFDARERLFRLLAALPAQGETAKPGSKEGA